MIAEDPLFILTRGAAQGFVFKPTGEEQSFLAK